jgi:uncharacterized protein YjiS (DUF1127 family)
MRSQIALGPLRGAPRPNSLPFGRPLRFDHTKHGARTLLRQLARSIGLWRERIRSRHQLRGLSDLDDHLLRDIGLTRGALLWKAVRPFLEIAASSPE